MYLNIIFISLLSSIISGLFSNYLNKKILLQIIFFYLIINLIFTFIIFFEIIYSNSICLIELNTWINVDTLNIHWSFLFDSLSCFMILIVNVISFLVHLYSINYMSEDPHFFRFFSFLSLFTFFMLIFLTASNFIQMFIGWEGIGLSSYLLINFWYTRYEANKSALKAVIVNKIGDVGIYFLIISIFFVCQSVDYSIVFSLPFYISQNHFYILNNFFSALNFISFFLFIGSIAKSAQLGLHTWLPDAMEGPTPVSALIHAATMVTAGVFLIIRCSPIIEYSSFILFLITFFGSITAFFAATVGVFQHDIKKVIAYSTCSQLGYMIFSCGLSNYSVALFHLCNHAFFKALLFLSAGAVIHAMMDEQDMRKYGGLLKFLPFTYSMFLIGSLSLMGFPFLTGFYSKDLILELSFSSYTFNGLFSYWLGLFSAFLTSFYSFRLIYLTFYIKPHSSLKIYKSVHEAPIFMFISLIILSLGSIFFGYIMRDLFVGWGVLTFSNSLIQNYPHILIIDSEFIYFFFKLFPFFLSIFGVFLLWFLYNKINKYFYNNLNYYKNIYLFFNKKWGFDLIYNYFIVDFFFFLSYYIFFKKLDRGFLELFGSLGLTKLISYIKKRISLLQQGYLFFYLLILYLSILILFIFLIIFFHWIYLVLFILFYFF